MEKTVSIRFPSDSFCYHNSAALCFKVHKKTTETQGDDAR